MDKEKVLDKVQKLINLASNNPEKGEAEAAMLRARELMMKYKIEAGELKDKDKIEIVELDTGVTFTKYTDKWINSLAKVIAKQYCCDSFMRHPYRARRRTVILIGEKDDVEIANKIFMYARWCIYKAIDEFRAEHYKLGYNITELRPYTDSYARGFIQGLQAKYEEQNSQHQEWGLVAVVPKQVQDFMSNLPTHSLGANRPIDNALLMEGYRDGREFSPEDKFPADLEEVPNEAVS